MLFGSERLPTVAGMLGDRGGLEVAKTVEPTESNCCCGKIPSVGQWHPWAWMRKSTDSSGSFCARLPDFHGASIRSFTISVCQNISRDLVISGLRALLLGAAGRESRSVIRLTGCRIHTNAVPGSKSHSNL